MPNYYIANWKMNPSSLKAAQALALGVERGVKGVKGAEVVVCPPSVFLPGLRTRLKLGAQDCFWEQKGPFTGELSPVQLKKAGCSFVILGHSERARYLGETAEQVKKKVAAALEAGLRPVVCVRETKKGVLGYLLSGVDKRKAKRVLVVYEPERAISTTKGGREVLPSELVGPTGDMKKALGELGLSSIPVLYGGSVDASNIRGFMSTGLIDGVLVGAASLGASSFSALVRKGQRG